MCIIRLNNWSDQGSCIYTHYSFALRKSWHPVDMTPTRDSDSTELAQLQHPHKPYTGILHRLFTSDTLVNYFCFSLLQSN